MTAISFCLKDDYCGSTDAQDVRIIRSKRRTVSLEITPEARLIVRVPERISDDAISRLIWHRRDWILSKQRQIEQVMATRASLNGSQADQIFFMGRRYPIHVVCGQKMPVVFDEGFWLSSRGISERRQVLIHWYMAQGERILTPLVSDFCLRINRSVPRVTMSRAENRWASCGIRDALHFSWRLVMAPLEVMTYVCAHEVAHLIHRHHRRSFWAVVARLWPDFRRHRQWLKDHEPLLRL